MVIDQVGLQCSEVPGKQTVPRAELYGTILAREAAGGDQALDILCDAAYVVKGASNYNADQLDAGSNGDLWHRSGMLAHQKPATAVKKIKAHAEAEVLAGKCQYCTTCTMPRLMREQTSWHSTWSTLWRPKQPNVGPRLRTSSRKGWL